MCELLFHPNLNLVEAEVIAREQGGRLVWSRGRVRLMEARAHVDAAIEAVMGDQYEAALDDIDAAQRQVEGWMV